MNRDRFRFFQCSHLETDLLIGIPPDQFRSGMDQCALREIRRVRSIIETYAGSHPQFLTSLEPLPVPEKVTSEVREIGAASVPEKGAASVPEKGAASVPEKGAASVPEKVAPGVREQGIPGEIGTMLRCGADSGTGPMSAVAGLVAEKVGNRLVGDYRLSELVVENGGDLFMVNNRDATTVIQAGDSPFSGKLALNIPAGSWGICTSSGTLGHSFSFGKADAVTVVAGSAPLADAWATSLANRVQSPADIEIVMALVEKIPEIWGCVAVVGDRVGIRGKFELKPLS